MAGDYLCVCVTSIGGSEHECTTGPALSGVLQQLSQRDGNRIVASKQGHSFLTLQPRNFNSATA
eukprot:838495-Amphidinium_carterae.3